MKYNRVEEYKNINPRNFTNEVIQYGVPNQNGYVQWTGIYQNMVLPHDTIAYLNMVMDAQPNKEWTFNDFYVLAEIRYCAAVSSYNNMLKQPSPNPKILQQLEIIMSECKILYIKGQIIQYQQIHRAKAPRGDWELQLVKSTCSPLCTYK